MRESWLTWESFLVLVCSTSFFWESVPEVFIPGLSENLGGLFLVPLNLRLLALQFLLFQAKIGLFLVPDLSHGLSGTHCTLVVFFGLVFQGTFSGARF